MTLTALTRPFAGAADLADIFLHIKEIDSEAHFGTIAAFVLSEGSPFQEDIP
jgi:hypothetical protein